jgi:hypothetical protein
VLVMRHAQANADAVIREIIETIRRHWKSIRKDEGPEDQPLARR